MCSSKKTQRPSRNSSKNGNKEERKAPTLPWASLPKRGGVLPWVSCQCHSLHAAPAGSSSLGVIDGAHHRIAPRKGTPMPLECWKCSKCSVSLTATAIDCRGSGLKTSPQTFWRQISKNLNHFTHLSAAIFECCKPNYRNEWWDIW